MALKTLNTIGGLSVGSNVNIVIDSDTNANFANLTVSSVSNLGPVSNVKITGGTNGYVLQTDGSGNLSWTTSGSGFGNLVAPMPTYIASANSFLVSANYQGLFAAPITVDGELVIDGVLVDVGGNNTISGSGAIATSGNISSGMLTVAYAPATTTGYGITVSAANTQGGTGYADFIKATNTSIGSTNPNKSFRLNSSGVMEIVNSSYTTTIFSLTDTGGLSVPGSISISGKQAVNGPAFRAYVAVGQAITSGSQQKVIFGTETFDTNSNFASSRFTPTIEGYYQLNATVRIAGTSGTGEVMIILYKNGSEYARGINESGTEQGSNFYSMQVSDIAYANGTTDYFEIYIQQSSGSNRDTTAGAAISYFSGCMLRGA